MKLIPLPHRSFVALILAVPVVWLGLARASSSPEIANIESAAKQENTMAVVNAIDKVVLAFTDENLAFLADLWNNNKAKYPSLPWPKLESPVVKVEIANVLLQAARNGHSIVNKSELHTYLRRQIESRDPVVKGMAAHAIGMAADNSDIPFLAALVKEEKPGIMEQAILGLVAIDSIEAKNKIRELEKAAKSPRAKEFLHNILQQPPFQ